MKPSIAPSNGEVIETTTRRRTLTAAEAQTEQSSDFWEYVANVRDWNEHIVYIARTEPAGADGKPITFTKCGPFLTCPDGQQIPITDQEEIEIAFLKHCGGKMYRFFIKRKTQIVAKSFLFIDGPPKSLAPWAGTMPAPAGQNPQNLPHIVTSQNTYGTDPTAAVASRAFDALGAQERTAAEIGFGAMKTAAEVMDRFGRGTTNDSTAILLRELLDEMRNQRKGMSLQEILAAVTSGLGILKELGILGQNTNPLIGQIMETGLKRLLEPPTASGTPTSTIGEVIRTAPAALAQLVDVIREQRLMSEAQLRSLELQRSLPAQAPRVAAPVNAQPNPQIIPPVTAPANGATNMQQLEFAESKVIEILGKYWNLQPFDADQAADDVIAFLEPFDANIVSTLASMGETGLVQYFQKRAILQQATSNMPRLIEFIRAFLKLHAEDVARAAAAAAPAAATQAKPN